MGYGSRALQLLQDFYEGKTRSLDEDEPMAMEETGIKTVDDMEVALLEETVKPRTALPPLLLRLNEKTPERLDYMGVSFGLTGQLLK